MFHYCFTNRGHFKIGGTYEDFYIKTLLEEHTNEYQGDYGCCE